jgi:ATP-dependent DNA helicase PIF1
MDQALALEILLNGENVLLTGAAGSGKTYLLNKFISHARSDGKSVSITATTGLAATHLNGSTIHSWSGIGILDSLPKDFFKNMPAGRAKTIRNTDILIIDEISMLHDYRLDMVDAVARKIRDVDAPFGGIQVVLCGDFFQLPPVSRNDQPAGEFIVNSQVWREFDPVICYLDEQHRQNDDEFLDILQALRAGDVRRSHAEKLLSRQNAVIDGSSEITELHTTNADVDAINSNRLIELSGEEHTYEMMTTGKENYVETLKRSCLALPELTLKKGSLVLCIKNNPEKKYVNGSQGTVIDFQKDSDYPIVEMRDGRKILISPETWELRDGDTKRASLAQIPLRLAWAITVHKSQGMTLDAAVVDLRRAFVEGMGYVALSRVRSLETLSLLGINQMALRVSPQALLIDESLRRKSAIDAKRLEKLRDNIKKRKNINSKIKSGSSWNDKVSHMREKYPNAYKPWSKADDDKLVTIFSSNNSVEIDELTKYFGRHPGSIKIRLKKHFGEDAVI